MPTIPEAIIAMLAITRIGAIDLVVFGGFGSGAIGERVRLSGAKVLLTADLTWRKGRETQLWSIVQEALSEPTSSVEQTVVLPRQVDKIPSLQAALDITGRACLAQGAEQSQ